jgi:hypothetical protein
MRSWHWDIPRGYTEDKHEAMLKEVREEWNKIEDEAPTVLQRYVDQAKKMAVMPTADETLLAPQ